MTKYRPGKVRHCRRCNAEIHWDLQDGFWKVHEMEDCITYLASCVAKLTALLLRYRKQSAASRKAAQPSSRGSAPIPPPAGRKEKR
jgi:hypothetical protein